MSGIASPVGCSPDHYAEPTRSTRGKRCLERRQHLATERAATSPRPAPAFGRLPVLGSPLAGHVVVEPDGPAQLDAPDVVLIAQGPMELAVHDAAIVARRRRI